MAFFRFNRDKKGYEHYYLVEPATNRRGKTKSRVLYWFRTPPGILVGREPFDEDVRRALETQYPSVSFDWRSILDAPIPSADADKWREKRRAERAAKALARADATDDAENDEPADSEPPADEAPGAVVEEAEATPVARMPADAAKKRRRRRRGRRPGTPDAARTPGDAAPTPDEPRDADEGEADD